MTKDVVMRAAVALVLCVSMMFGSIFLATPNVSAQVDDAIFNGTVTLDGLPAPDTLIMYSIGGDGAPVGNSTVTDVSGDYEIWVEGGETYTLYFANGESMFDSNAMIEQYIAPGETVTVDTDLTPAPERTAILKGFITNASDPMDPVVDCTVLGLHMIMGLDMPDYVNWTASDGTGYYEMEMLSGLLAGAVLSADGYYPAMPGPMTMPIAVEDGESEWYNISLIPMGEETVTFSGTVYESSMLDPIEGATVRTTLESSVSWSDTTDSLGDFEIAMLDGDGEIVVEAAGYSSQRDYVTFYPGTFMRDYVLSAVDATLEGHVYDAVTLEPIEDAQLEANLYLEEDSALVNWTSTDSSGYFTMDVTSGHWWIGAGADGYAYSSEETDVGSGGTEVVDLYLMPKSSVVKGYVTDSSTDLPISMAIVRLESDMSDGEGNYTGLDGYYEVWCGAGEYQMLFMAGGYMWEMQRDPVTVVGPDEVLWMNHSLAPAETEITGTVTDAADDTLLDGASVQVASFSPDPDFFRVAMTETESGVYSMMVAPDPECIISAQMSGYQSYSDFIEIPDVPTLLYDIKLMPDSVSDTYTLMGYANDSGTDLPIPNVLVTAYFGTSWIDDTYTDGTTGYYEIELPCVDLTLTASGVGGMGSSGYLPDEVLVSRPTPGAAVWLNFSMDPHTTPPVVDATVDPDAYVSTLNPSDLLVTVEDDYLSYVVVSVEAVVGEDVFSSLTVSIDSSYFDPENPFWSSMSGTETSPGVWETGLPGWDTAVSEDSAVLRDGMGAPLYIGFDYWLNEMEGYWYVSGEYDNDTIVGPWSGQAVFDSSGALMGIDFGSGLDTDVLSDDTGWFSKYVLIGSFNKISGAWEGSSWDMYVQMNVPTMYFERLGQADSGDYYAFFHATDLASNWEGYGIPFTVDNDPPTAVAMDGFSTIVNVTETLDASASYDNYDPGIANYTWEFQDGPDDIVLWDVTVDYAFEYVGNHTVTLTVRDNAGYQSTDTTWVNVLADGAPVADAGPDQTVDDGETVYFDGSGSDDDLGIENWTWTIVGLGDTLYGVLPEYTFAGPDEYTVELVVRDTIGQESSPDSMTVTVLDITDPVADAGDDQEVSYGDLVTFDGEGSSDDVAVTSYEWTFDDDGPVTLTGMTPTHTFSAPGTYTVNLTVSDDGGNEDVDTMTVIVVDDEAPVADAGSDPVGVVAGDTVTLDGTDSTDNYLITSYTWNFTDGTAVILDGMEPTYTFDNEGEFVITLTVVDTAGLSDTDIVVVRVAPMNEAPDADAGDDQTVTEGDTVEFDGSGSSDDVGIESYTWTFEYDGEIETLTGETAEFVFKIPGTYIVTLNVTDEDGEWDTDTMVVIVEDKAATFLTEYWWLFAAVAAVAVIGALVALMMKRGKGGPGTPAKEDEGEEFEDEDELPPPDDEDF